MGILGKLFGSDQALAKVVDTGRELLDEAFYTDQEEAQDRAAAAKQARGMVVEWMAATTGSRISRRLLAVSITFTWLGLFLLATALSFAAIWSDAPQQLALSAELIDGRSDRMTPAVMLILGFYFALPYVGEMATGALQKFGSKST